MTDLQQLFNRLISRNNWNPNFMKAKIEVSINICIEFYSFKQPFQAIYLFIDFYSFKQLFQTVIHYKYSYCK